MIEKQQSAGVSDAAHIRAEAAAWIARLHGPDRAPADEAGFQRWLKANPAHARAFEQMTDLWDAGARLKTDTLARVGNASRARARTRVRFARFAIATAAVAAIAGVSIVRVMSNAAITTGIGEQRILTLEDGTRITLNTATQLKVRYDDHQRRIELKNGEALFEVAKRKDWPFIVTTGEKAVTALGTTFVVRHDTHQTAVTLIEGKVAVASQDDLAASGEAIYRSNGSSSAQTGGQAPDASYPIADLQPVVLAAGQRLIFEGGEAPKLDKPSLEKVTAWKQGLVELDNTPLSDAIAEMNRYSVVPLVLADPDRTNVRVSGVFRAGDSLEFARAVAAAYGLSVSEEPEALVLRAAAQR
jgi:transmembrane sensor